MDRERERESERERKASSSTTEKKNLLGLGVSFSSSRLGATLARHKAAKNRPSRGKNTLILAANGHH
jgi:hypothetical protein